MSTCPIAWRSSFMLANQIMDDMRCHRPHRNELHRQFASSSLQLLHLSFIMASSMRPVVRLATRSQITSYISRPPSSSLARATSQFHTSSSRNATPAGPPPQGYRLPRPARFDEGENTINKASNYFLLTEIFRGMYVVLEQFFRPP